MRSTSPIWTSERGPGRAGRLLLLLALLAYGTGCGLLQPAAEREIEVLEAVYRHQMAGNGSGLGSAATLFCLQRVRGSQRQDPPEALLRRFTEGGPKVKPASRCRLTGEQHGDTVIDPETKRQGLILAVGEIACGLSGSCTVDGERYEGNLGAEGYRYRIERRSGGWRVTASNMIWIS